MRVEEIATQLQGYATEHYARSTHEYAQRLDRGLGKVERQVEVLTAQVGKPRSDGDGYDELTAEFTTMIRGLSDQLTDERFAVARLLLSNAASAVENPDLQLVVLGADDLARQRRQLRDVYDRLDQYEAQFGDIEQRVGGIESSLPF